MRPRLTEAYIARLKPPAKGYTWRPDHLLPSFGLREYSTSAMSWGITRRWAGAKQPSFRKIGEYPTMSLAQARTLARKILADPDGTFPAKHPPKRPAQPRSFEALAEEFLAHGRTRKGRPLRASSLTAYRYALMVCAKPLHQMPVAEIRRADAAALLRTIAKTSGTTTSQHCRATGGRFFNWLIANDLVERNPFQHTEPYAIQPRSRVLADGELAAIWAATDDDRDFSAIVRMLLWTGARRAEIGGLRWSELSADGTWHLPAERSKNNSPLSLPLPKQALAALASRPRIVGRDLMFGLGPDGFTGWSRRTTQLRERTGIDRHWSLHDCRRTTETRLAGLGVSRDLVTRILNHGRDVIARTYDHYDYAEPMRGALQAWADQLDRIVNAGPRVIRASR